MNFILIFSLNNFWEPILWRRWMWRRPHKWLSLFCKLEIFFFFYFIQLSLIWGHFLPSHWNNHEGKWENSLRHSKHLIWLSLLLSCTVLPNPPLLDMIIYSFTNFKRSQILWGRKKFHVRKEMEETDGL